MPKILEFVHMHEILDDYLCFTIVGNYHSITRLFEISLIISDA